MTLNDPANRKFFYEGQKSLCETLIAYLNEARNINDIRMLIEQQLALSTAGINDADIDLESKKKGKKHGKG